MAAVMLAAATAAAQVSVTPPPTFDPAVLARAAQLAYSRDLARAREGKALNADPATLARARHAAEPLIENASDILPAAESWTWILSVETRPEAIAYCLPAGKVLVSSALFDRVKLTDDEFAAIVAHVVAHALIGKDADAAVAAYRRTRATATPDPDVNRAALQLADALGKVMLSTRYDGAAERAADAMALDLMARAGIDPSAAAGAWRKVAAAGGTAPQDLAVLHPVGTERIAAIEAQLPVVMPVYRHTLATRPPRGPAPPLLRR
jgi:predicted Zn-dependent protease